MHYLSEDFIIDKLAKPISEIKTERIRMKFYLVVSALDVGPDAIVSIQARASQGADGLSEAQRELINAIFDLDDEFKKCDSHYDVIDLWYSEFFDQYIRNEGIIDVTEFDM